MIVIFVKMCKMITSTATFYIFSKFKFWGGFNGVQGEKMTQNYLFQSVTLYISGTVYHIDEILVRRCKAMISPSVSLFSEKIKKMQHCKYWHILVFSLSNSFLINSCFSSSSIKKKNKFWGVLHLLQMRMIFYKIAVLLLEVKQLKVLLCR